MNSAQVKLTLPDWSISFTERYGECFSAPESRMVFALSIAQKNIEQGGGPFAAAVFNQRHELVSIGMNLVVPARCSILHAEITALILAEQAVHDYDLSHHGQQQLELVSTCEPCTMCLGAVIWSGVTALSYAARDEDARAIGFDEGPKPNNSALELERRGIHVTKDLLREQSVALLQNYKNKGSTIYNPGANKPK